MSLKLKKLPLSVHNNDSKMVTFIINFTEFLKKFSSLLNQSVDQLNSDKLLKQERREMSSMAAQLFREFAKDEILFPILSGIIIAYHKKFAFNYKEAQDILNIVVRFGITATTLKSDQNYSRLSLCIARAKYVAVEFLNNSSIN